ncbi:hypothetical protein ABPG72_019994 [Tetrahymena utriculariae]
MPRATSPFSRGVIIASYETQKSPQDCLDLLIKIKAKQGKNDACSLQTVQNLYKQWVNNKKFEANYSQNERKIVYSSQDTKKVVEQFNKNLSITLRKAENDKTANPKQMSYSTIKRALNDNNLQAYKVPTIQKINESQKNKDQNLHRKLSNGLKNGKAILFSYKIFLKRGKIGNKFLWKASRSEIKAEECYQQ